MSYADPGLGTHRRVPPARVNVANALTRPAGRRPAGRRPAPRFYNPFAPVTMRDVAHAGDVYGPVMTERQIQQRAGREAHAQIDPLLSSIMGDIQKRETAAQGNLGGATRAYVDAVGQYGPGAQQAYTDAAHSQADVDAAIAQALAGGGTRLAGELGAKLGAAGISSPAPAAAAATGAGAGNAALTSGSAELSRLLASGAAEGAYGAKLPGIAAAEGQRRSAELAGQYASQLGDRTREVTASLPGLIQGLVDSLRSTNEKRIGDRAAAQDAARTRATNAEVFRREYGLKEYGAATDRLKARTSAQHTRSSDRTRARAVDVAARSLGERSAHNRANEQAAADRNRVSQQNVNERVAHDKATERAAERRVAASEARAHGSVDEAASRSRGILVGKDGKPILRYKVKGGKRVPGTGRTIPYKPKKSGSSAAAAAVAAALAGSGK